MTSLNKIKTKKDRQSHKFYNNNYYLKFVMSIALPQADDYFARGTRFTSKWSMQIILGLREYWSLKRCGIEWGRGGGGRKNVYSTDENQRCAPVRLE